MSSRNGDRSRFHRERKQKIARRMRTQELIKAANQPKKDSPVVRSTTRSVAE